MPHYLLQRADVRERRFHVPRLHRQHPIDRRLPVHASMTWLYRSNFVGALERTMEDLAAYQDSSCENWVDLVQADSYLREAVLNRANLSRVVFDRSNFSASNLNGARIYHASFVGLVLDRAEFDGADLSAAILVTACFVGANLAGADVTGAVPFASQMADSTYDGETAFPSGFDYTSAPWGLGDRTAPWDSGMTPVPEPCLDLGLLFDVIASASLELFRTRRSKFSESGRHEYGEGATEERSTAERQ